MIDSFGAEIEWLGAESGTDTERASFGALSLHAGDVSLTEVIDLIAQTPRTSIRVCINTLARWLVENWWRLRWEPSTATEPSVAWRMAHEISAAGGGFVWPRMQFASDGQTVTIHAEPTAKQHTIRYIGTHELICTASAFERGLDDLLSAVVARQETLGAVDAELQGTWRAVREERQDLEASSFRKREALLGLNPGEISTNELRSLFARGIWAGEQALDETLAGLGVNEANGLLKALAELRKEPLKTVSFAKVLQTVSSWSGPRADLEPWQNGDSFAQHVRGCWNLGNNPITDEFLNDLIGANIHSDLVDSKAPPFVGFRDDDCLRPVLKRSFHKSSRRFAIARLFADAAVAHASDTLLPLTASRTARQKLQRAAAQELLCPIDGLTERLTLPNPDADELAEAADHFQVSQLVVRSALVNKKLVDRTYLD